MQGLFPPATSTPCGVSVGSLRVFLPLDELSAFFSSFSRVAEHLKKSGHVLVCAMHPGQISTSPRNA